MIIADLLLVWWFLRIVSVIVSDESGGVGYNAVFWPIKKTHGNERKYNPPWIAIDRILFIFTDKS